MSRLPKSTLEGSSYTPHRKRKYVVTILLIPLVLFIVFEYMNNNISAQNLESFLHYNFTSPLSSTNTQPQSSSIETTTVAINASAPFNGTFVFCINRGIFRTSNSRGSNQSQIQTLVNYCEYNGYNPGISNGTNYTSICQGVQECQMGGFPIGYSR